MIGSSSVLSLSLSTGEEKTHDSDKHKECWESRESKQVNGESMDVERDEESGCGWGLASGLSSELMPELRRAEKLRQATFEARARCEQAEVCVGGCGGGEGRGAGVVMFHMS